LSVVGPRFLCHYVSNAVPGAPKKQPKSAEFVEDSDAEAPVPSTASASTKSKGKGKQKETQPVVDETVKPAAKRVKRGKKEKIVEGTSTVSIPVSPMLRCPTQMWMNRRKRLRRLSQMTSNPVAR
jgi:hypothetical protein